ncbi:Peptidyl-prolyl cis-trans isomerase CWC27 like protein [Eufriesea mexicana]|uniref:Peptidyl-prolyl cis-trans isomerase n=1 Tax=Eufriesea mexicana TaxID=516756 RepID=A0A310S958_9HYME|nr:Peptidyl-prolyl cis-trans isomerase CWC27 like protein [Eufriesea mexicana]
MVKKVFIKWWWLRQTRRNEINLGCGLLYPLDMGNTNDGAELCKEKRVVRMKTVTRGNANYAESRNRKEVVYISTEKAVLHGHTNIWVIEGMENEQIIKGFITQDGDPTGTGKGGKIYGEPFKGEVHTRLRFWRRDLIAIANALKDDNGSEFFFALSSTSDLQNKHTIFGKVTGEITYNMLKLEEALVDEINY